MGRAATVLMNKAPYGRSSKRGYRWPGPRPSMNGNYLNIKHKKCKLVYDGRQAPSGGTLGTSEIFSGTSSLCTYRGFPVE